MRRLAEYVHIDGEVYEPGTKESDLPNGVAERITNPAAWGGEGAKARTAPSNADGAEDDSNDAREAEGATEDDDAGKDDGTKPPAKTAAKAPAKKTASRARTAPSNADGAEDDSK